MQQRPPAPTQQAPQQQPALPPQQPQPQQWSEQREWELRGTAPDVFSRGDELASGRYSLQQKIYDGAFVTLWLANDKATQRRVVLKLMEAGDMPSFNASNREISMHRLACSAAPAPDTQPSPARDGGGSGAAAAAVGGGAGEVGRAHIVQLLDSFEHRSARGRHACMVLEPLGDSVAYALRAYAGGLGRGVAPDAARSIARQTLLALDHLHRSKGVVHMAVAADNLLLDRPFASINDLNPWEALCLRVADAAAALGIGRGGDAVRRPGCRTEMDLEEAGVKLGDFGRALRPAQLHVAPDVAVVLAPPGLRPPEEVLGLPYEAPSYDMWALGCLVYQLSTGEALFAPTPKPRWGGGGGGGGAGSAGGAGGGAGAARPGLDINDAHLAEMTAVLGRLPRDMIEAAPLRDRYFPGRRRRLVIEAAHRIAREPLPLILVQEHGMEVEEAQLLTDFLAPLLAYHPHKRPSALEALSHPWLSVSDGGGGNAADSGEHGGGGGGARAGGVA